MKVVVDPIIKPEIEFPGQRYKAVLFRNTIYVAAPFHADCIDLAFKKFTDLQKIKIYDRISEGKETILLGSARSDGSEWEWDERYHKARMEMYGFD